MALFVEDFMEGIMAHAELACHHKQFRDPDQMEMLKEKLCAYFKFKLDGSRFYIGKSMADVHRNLGITDDLFDKACDVFLASLKKLKPKAKVLKAFVRRIKAVQNEICFPPPLQDLSQGHQCDSSQSDSLFNDLGQEQGLRQIVDSMLEQARVNNINLFKQINDVDD